MSCCVARAGGGQGALVEAGNEVAQLLAKARADRAAGGAVGLLVRQVLRQLLHQGAPAALQQDHQICARTTRSVKILGSFIAHSKAWWS